MRGVDDRDLRPRRQLRRRDVLPRDAAVRGGVNQPVVGAGPDAVDVGVARRDGVDDAALGRRGRGASFVDADVGRHVPRLAREIGTDGRPPTHAAARRLPQAVRREVQRPRIDRRKQHRLRSDDAIGIARRRARPNLDHFAGPPVVARDLPAVDDVGIERIGRDVAVFLDADGVPLAERDPAVVAAALHARGSALLLPAAHAIGKRVVGADVVELRGRLVVPGAPRVAAVDRNDGALIRGERG